MADREKKISRYQLEQARLDAPCQSRRKENEYEG